MNAAEYIASIEARARRDGCNCPDWVLERPHVHFDGKVLVIGKEGNDHKPDCGFNRSTAICPAPFHVNLASEDAFHPCTDCGIEGRVRVDDWWCCNDEDSALAEFLLREAELLGRPR